MDGYNVSLLDCRYDLGRIIFKVKKWRTIWWPPSIDFFLYFSTKKLGCGRVLNDAQLLKLKGKKIDKFFTLNHCLTWPMYNLYILTGFKNQFSTLLIISFSVITSHYTGYFEHMRKKESWSEMLGHRLFCYTFGWWN